MRKLQLYRVQLSFECGPVPFFGSVVFVKIATFLVQKSTDGSVGGSATVTVTATGAGTAVAGGVAVAAILSTPGDTRSNQKSPTAANDPSYNIPNISAPSKTCPPDNGCEKEYIALLNQREILRWQTDAYPSKTCRNISSSEPDLVGGQTDR